MALCSVRPALSWITQLDQRDMFDLWGITYSSKAAEQVSAYGFARQPAVFYANTNTLKHKKVRKVDMTVTNPRWPF